jgi:hypothetical protein
MFLKKLLKNLVHRRVRSEKDANLRLRRTPFVPVQTSVLKVCMFVCIVPVLLVYLLLLLLLLLLGNVCEPLIRTEARNAIIMKDCKLMKNASCREEHAILFLHLMFNSYTRIMIPF